MGGLWLGNGVYMDANGNLLAHNKCNQGPFIQNNVAKKSPRRPLLDKPKKAEGEAVAKKTATKMAPAANKAAENAERPEESSEERAKRKEAEKLVNAEKDAETYLRFAQHYIDTNDRVGAINYLDTVIAKFPKTKAAAEAKKLLKIQ
jgi:hypothetical protein